MDTEKQFKKYFKSAKKENWDNPQRLSYLLNNPSQIEWYKGFEEINNTDSNSILCVISNIIEKYKQGDSHVYDNVSNVSKQFEKTSRIRTFIFFLILILLEIVPLFVEHGFTYTLYCLIPTGVVIYCFLLDNKLGLFRRLLLCVAAYCIFISIDSAYLIGDAPVVLFLCILSVKQSLRIINIKDYSRDTISFAKELKYTLTDMYDDYYDAKLSYYWSKLLKKLRAIEHSFFKKLDDQYVVCNDGIYRSVLLLSVLCILSVAMISEGEGYLGIPIIPTTIIFLISYCLRVSSQFSKGKKFLSVIYEICFIFLSFLIDCGLIIMAYICFALLILVLGVTGELMEKNAVRGEKLFFRDYFNKSNDVTKWLY